MHVHFHVLGSCTWQLFIYGYILVGTCMDINEIKECFSSHSFEHCALAVYTGCKHEPSLPVVLKKVSHGRGH